MFGKKPKAISLKSDFRAKVFVFQENEEPEIEWVDITKEQFEAKNLKGIQLDKHEGFESEYGFVVEFYTIKEDEQGFPIRTKDDRRVFVDYAESFKDESDNTILDYLDLATDVDPPVEGDIFLSKDGGGLHRIPMPK